MVLPTLARYAMVFGVSVGKVGLLFSGTAAAMVGRRAAKPFNQTHPLRTAAGAQSAALRDESQAHARILPIKATAASSQPLPLLLSPSSPPTRAGMDPKDTIELTDPHARPNLPPPCCRCCRPA